MEYDDKSGSFLNYFSELSWERIVLTAVTSTPRSAVDDEVESLICSGLMVIGVLNWSVEAEMPASNCLDGEKTSLSLLYIC